MRISDWSSDVCSSDLLDPAIKVTATCVRVPVFVGHAEALNIEFERPITEEQARKALAAQPGCIVVDHRANEGYVTPAECAGEDAVYVRRIRSDPTIDNGLSLWVVSDNLRKGAALNTVQIAATLVKAYLRSEERRVGQEGCRPLRTPWAPVNLKKKNET